MFCQWNHTGGFRKRLRLFWFWSRSSFSSSDDQNLEAFWDFLSSLELISLWRSSSWWRSVSPSPGGSRPVSWCSLARWSSPRRSLQLPVELWTRHSPEGMSLCLSYQFITSVSMTTLTWLWLQHLSDRVAMYVHAYTLYSAVRPFGCRWVSVSLNRFLGNCDAFRDSRNIWWGSLSLTPPSCVCSSQLHFGFVRQRRRSSALHGGPVWDLLREWDVFVCTRVTPGEVTDPPASVSSGLLGVCNRQSKAGGQDGDWEAAGESAGAPV